MQLLWTKQFKKDYKSLPEKIKKSIKKQFRIMAQDSCHPSLQIKKTKGVVLKGYSNVFEGRITKNYRPFFLIESGPFILLRCGTHDEFLK